MNKILVVEDDEMLNAGLCYNLNQQGYEAMPVYNYKSAKLQLEKDWQLIILDVNLPDGNGFELCQYIQSSKKIPVLFLTANDLDEDVIRGFELGADDYITKPFNILVFLQRVKVILRRYDYSKDSTFLCGNLKVDFEKRTITKKGIALNLTPTEYKLLYILSSNPNKVVTRRILLEELWDQYGNYVEEHALTIQISRLRSKIADEQYSYIKTIYGMGYQWSEAY